MGKKVAVAAEYFRHFRPRKLWDKATLMSMFWRENFKIFKMSYLITSECPGPEFHDTRLLIEREVGNINCTRALQIEEERT